ncbi:MAG: type I-G CRISPR-associated protein Cas8g1/Csx17 [Thermoanaerobaculia bacterium]
MNVLRLDGCTLTPLAGYLKSLGVLRILAAQVDREARGWWDGRVFTVATVLTAEDLVRFILERYEPTPLFNPWGARSGFYSGSSETSARKVLSVIESSSDPRFSTYRRAIADVRSVLQTTTGGAKPGDDPEGKRRLIAALRRELRGNSSEWMDAVIAVVDGSFRGLEQPALFGTGGSEGSGSYTSAYMAALEECLIRRRWDHALPGTLFGAHDVAHHSWEASFGQYLPSGLGTPWDLLLAFEGGCEIRSSVAVRSGTRPSRWLASPFYVAPRSEAYASRSRLDEYALNKGKELPGRGEQWFPVWSQPSTRAEVAQVFRDGRAVTRKQRATDGWSMLKAVRTLGVSRGVDSFLRYGYLQRNNQSTHFAVPLGQIDVTRNAGWKVACLDDVEVWCESLRRHSRAKHAPARLFSVESNLAESIFACTVHVDEPSRWQEVLLRLADVEACQVSGSGYGAGPIPRLRPEWISTADDGSAEFRLALSFALQYGGSGSSGDRGTVRRHWLPLDGARYATSGTGVQRRLRFDPSQVMKGRNGVDDANAVVARRLIESAQRGERKLPLLAARHAAAFPTDVAAFMSGDVDSDRTFRLARALMAIDSAAWRRAAVQLSRPAYDRFPDDAWVAIRLTMLPWALRDGTMIHTDPSIHRRLAAGDVATAFEVARQKLIAAGIDVTVRAASVPASLAKRWAAALAFPISKRTAWRFATQLDPRTAKKEN